MNNRFQLLILSIMATLLLAGCGSGSPQTQETYQAHNPGQVQDSVQTQLTSATQVETSTQQTYSEPAAQTETSGQTQGATDAQYTQHNNSIHKGKVIDIDNSSSLNNVAVAISNKASSTDRNGNYGFENISKSSQTVVTFKKHGYLPKSIKIEIKDKASDGTALDNYAEISMKKHQWVWDYTTQEGENGTVINIPANTRYKNDYQGTIKAYATRLKGKELRDNFPGAFKGIDSNGQEVLFKAYGMVSAYLYDNDDNPVDIASGETVTYTFEVERGTADTETLPAWFYNENTGVWTEEGIAYRQSDGTYKADLSQIGTWSICETIESEPGIYRGHISYPDGTPASAVRIKAEGDSWITHDLSTDDDGNFELKVVPSKPFKLKVYDYKYKFSTTYNDVIPSINSGDVVEE